MLVLNYGSLNIYYVYSVDHIFREGETVAASGMEVFCGGKGLNQSIALSRAGISVYP
jgi:ribokinase